MKVKQIHKNIGVSIEGIDLSRIDNNVFQQIKDLWLEHLIIIFPNQNISPALSSLIWILKYKKGRFEVN